VDRTNFEAVHNIITNRFQLSGDFQLQVKDDSGVMMDIDTDGDADDNMEFMHTIWVIPTEAKEVSETQLPSLSTLVPRQCPGA
jgi:hypothetical protein